MKDAKGVAATVSRNVCAFLKVTMPVKLTTDPFDDTLHGSGRVGEAVKDAANPSGKALHHLERILHGIALMDHAIEPKLRRHFELLWKMRSWFR